MTMQKARFIRYLLSAITILWSLGSTAAEVRQPVVVGTLDIFYGVIPAAVLLGHPADHTEPVIHVWNGRGGRGPAA